MASPSSLTMRAASSRWLRPARRRAAPRTCPNVSLTHASIRRSADARMIVAERLEKMAQTAPAGQQRVRILSVAGEAEDAFDLGDQQVRRLRDRDIQFDV